MTTMHKVVSHDEWIAARQAFLLKEKEFTHQREELARQRRELPWEAIDKPYAFEGANGKRSLAELFGKRSQLVIYHFMYGPDWDAGCPHCSRWADNFNGIIVHLNQRDVSFAAVSRAPYAKLAAYRQRMGWSFDWYSSFGSDFNFDFGVSFTPDEVVNKRAFYNFTMQDMLASEREGVSVFFKDADARSYRTYATFARGIDMLNLDYQYLDLVPKGRDENGRGPYWVKRHDEY